MPYRLCQTCRQPGRFLADVSKRCAVEYYYCDNCGNAWSHDKNNPSASAVPVTQPHAAAQPHASPRTK